jgi:rhodanese-related sulfurtransferase
MKKGDNLFQQLQIFEQEINRLESKVLELENRIEHLIQVERNHLIRVKNREELPDDFIQQGRKYQDLSSEKAWRLYQDKDLDFILIDVSAVNFDGGHLPEAVKIPWEVFPERFLEIQSKTTPLFIISEDGTNSVLACEFLVKRGYFNCNNISGGHKFWKGHRLQAVRSESA